MADGETYLIGLNNQVSGPAEAAARSTRALTNALAQVQGEMDKLDKQSVFAAMKGDSAKIAGITKDLEKLEKAAAQIKAQMVPAIEPVIDKTQSLGEALEGLAGPAAVAVAALAAVGAATAGLAIWGGMMAIDASDFKGDTIDALELVLETRDAASTTYDRLADIANHTTMTNEDVQKRAFDLLAAGIHDGEQLDSTIRSIADLTAVKGEQAAGKLDKIIERATTSGGFQVSAKQLMGTGVQMSDLIQNIADRTGEGVDKVAAQLKKGKVDVDVGIDAINEVIAQKLGGFAAKQLNDLDVQFKRFKDNSKALFADIDTDKFLAGLATITGMLDQSTVTGQALKELVQDVFQPMFDQATKLFPYIKIGFEEAIIVALELYIALRPVREEFAKWLGTKGDVDGFEKSMMGVGEAFRITAAFAVPFIQGQVQLLEAMVSVVNFFYGPYIAILKAMGGGAELAAAEKARTGGQTAGEALAAGMAAGITGGMPDVHRAADALAGGAKDRVTKTLDIHSPSRVMQELGEDTADGFEAGLRGGTGDAHEAMGSLAAPPSPARPGASSSGGGGTRVDVGGIVIHISGEAASAGPASIGDELAIKLAAFFETLQLQAGA